MRNLTDEELKALQSLTAIFFRLEHPVSPESVLDASRDLMAWFAKHPDGPPVKRLFRELLATGLERFKKYHPLPPIPEDLEEVMIMLATHVEKWEKNIEQRSERKGRLDGERNEAIKILLRQLTRRFGTLSTSLQEKVNAADTETLELWSDLVLDARSLEDVFDSNNNMN
ncbi:MAG: DUF4351 domain-containing protein [Magnetococcus sp. DMHC-6]